MGLTARYGRSVVGRSAELSPGPSQVESAAGLSDAPGASLPFEVHDARWTTPDLAWLAGAVSAPLDAVARLPPLALGRRLEAIQRRLPPRVVALDLETTGFGAGGTIPFMIGALYERAEGDGWALRQWCLRSMGGERPMIEDCVAFLRGLGPRTLLTYNGKSFDLPVMRGRTRRLSMETFAVEGAHLDLLHPARRLWDEGRGTCRLTALERRLLDRTRVGDIDGSEIPDVFWARLATPRCREVAERWMSVRRHNALDLASLLVLAGHAAHAHAAPRTLREAMAASHPSVGATPAEVVSLLAPWCGDDAPSSPVQDRAEQRLRDAHGRCDDWDGVARSLRRGLRHTPDDPGAIRRLAWVLERRLRRPREALEVLRGDRHACPRRIARLQRQIERAS